MIAIALHILGYVVIPVKLLIKLLKWIFSK